MAEVALAHGRHTPMLRECVTESEPQNAPSQALSAAAAQAPRPPTFVPLVRLRLVRSVQLVAHQSLRCRLLGQVVVEPCLACLVLVVIRSPAGERYQNSLIRLCGLSDHAGHFIADQPRHADVQKRQVRPALNYKTQGIGAVVRDGCLMATQLQQSRQALHCVDVVIDDYNLEH